MGPWTTRFAPLVALLLLAATAMADPPQPVTLNLNAIGAEGVVRVNGVPQRYFKEAGPKVSHSGGGTFTNASLNLFMSTAYLLLCAKGSNPVHGRYADYGPQRRGPHDTGQIHGGSAAVRSEAEEQRYFELFAG